jgi:hypothetical protein
MGLKQGVDFCPHSGAIFDEALAVPSGSMLVEYAAAKDVIPANLGACIGPEHVAEKRAAPTRKALKH